MSTADHDVYAHANPVFVREVSAHGSAPIVLDGCWNGALGRTLIRESGAIVDGIERDAAQPQEPARTAIALSMSPTDLDQEVPEAGDRRYAFILSW